MAAKRKKVLTPGRMRLAKAYAAQGTVKMAAHAAEMSLPAAYTAMHDPGVQELIKREQLHLLITKGVPIAVRSLLQVSEHGKNESARNQASKEILAIAKMNPDLITDNADGKTLQELEAWMERLKAHNAKHAKIIDAEVIEEGEEPGALD